RHTRFSRDWSSDVCSSDLFLIEVYKLLPTGIFNPKNYLLSFLLHSLCGSALHIRNEEEFNCVWYKARGYQNGSSCQTVQVIGGHRNQGLCHRTTPAVAGSGFGVFRNHS